RPAPPSAESAPAPHSALEQPSALPGLLPSLPPSHSPRDSLFYGSRWQDGETPLPGRQGLFKVANEDPSRPFASLQGRLFDRLRPFDKLRVSGAINNPLVLSLSKDENEKTL